MINAHEMEFWITFQTPVVYMGVKLGLSHTEGKTYAGVFQNGMFRKIFGTLEGRGNKGGEKTT
jgi:hypothetical protein